MDNFLKNFGFRAVEKYANLVDLEKCCKMTIWSSRSASIQPRTSLGKSDVSWRWILEDRAFEEGLEAELDAALDARGSMEHRFRASFVTEVVRPP